MRNVVVFFFFLIAASIQAQDIEQAYGHVGVSASVGNGSLDDIRMMLICGKDTLKEDYVYWGEYYWNKVPVGVVVCKVWADGYITLSDTVRVEKGKLSKKYFSIKDQVLELKGVMVKGHFQAVSHRGDTIRFDPIGVQVMEDDVVRNILEQMPDVQVADNGESEL